MPEFVLQLKLARRALAGLSGSRKTQMKALILYPLVLFCLSAPAVADVTVSSPDGHVQFVLSSNAQGHLEYTVTFNSKSIIDPSPLGIVVDRVDLADGRADRLRGNLQNQRNLSLVRRALHRGEQLQRRQGGAEASGNGNGLYARNPGIRRRRRLPSPGAGRGRPHAR